MKENSKKLFPKLKKKLKWFITDESWKITKKDAFWLSVWVMLLTWAEEVLAAGSCVHSNVLTWWATRYNPGWTFTSIWAPISWTITSHGSWIVNWHYSATPNGWLYSWYNAGTTYTSLWVWESSYTWHSNSSTPHVSHASHASHWSHWSHAAY